MIVLPVLGTSSPSCDLHRRTRRTGLGALRLVAPLSLLALSLTAACGVEEEAVPVAEGVIDRELAIDLDDPNTLSAELEARSEDSDADLLAYCDDVVTWNSAWVTLEGQVLSLVNQKRAAGATCGGVVKPRVPALTLDTRLRCSARKHSKDMGSKNFFSHTGSNGSSFSMRITSAGYAWTAAAENIAAGNTTAAAVVNSWMASTGHCNNIMSSAYRHLGVGYYYAATATYKHYWTQNFGRQ